MNVGRDSKKQKESFIEIITLLEKNLRYVESLGMDEQTLQDYRKVLSYLRARSPDEIDRILEKPTSRKTRQTDTEPDLTDEEIGRLKGEQIKRFLAAQKVSRSFLERLASIRFGVTKGALSTLRNREALVGKIQTLLAHEGTHEAISRAGMDQPDASPPKLGDS